MLHKTHIIRYHTISQQIEFHLLILKHNKHNITYIVIRHYILSMHCNLPSSAVWTGRFYESAKVRLSPGVNKIEVGNKGSIKLELANEEGKWIWANEILIQVKPFLTYKSYLFISDQIYFKLKNILSLISLLNYHQILYLFKFIKQSIV